jgi:hypothetical protein
VGVSNTTLDIFHTSFFNTAEVPVVITIPPIIKGIVFMGAVNPPLAPKVCNNVDCTQYLPSTDDHN